MWTDEQAVRRAVQYIAGALDSPLTVADIAAQAGYSPFHFCRMFRAAAGHAGDGLCAPAEAYGGAAGGWLRGEKAIDAALGLRL